MEYANRLFDRYVTDLAVQRPLVVFPPSVSAGDIRSRKPVLFLAVLAAAAGTLDDNLSTKLSGMVDSLVAEHVVIRGEKSLELIQAILITMNWYYVPDKYELLKFSQFSNMAATMALDIGLVGTKQSLATEEALEGYRTLLGCYVCCSRYVCMEGYNETLATDLPSISLKYHRPNMFLFTPEMAECLKALEESPNAAPTDPVLAGWVKLQHTVDLSATALGLRSEAFQIDLADERTWQDLQSCATQLISWRRAIPSSASSGGWTFHLFCRSALWSC